MSYKRTAPAGLISVGFEKITQNNSTAVGLNTTTRWGTVLMFTVETQAARARFDGSAAATSTGVLFPTGTVHMIEGYPAGGTAASFFRSAGGTSIINVQAFRRPGDPTSA